MRDLQKNSHNSPYHADDAKEASLAHSDYRTQKAESICLPGETAIDKCIRIATWLRIEQANGNLRLDLPNPQFPKVYDGIDTRTLKMYLRVREALSWLELAAARTYRKSRKRALPRLYSNLEKESGVSQRVFRNIRSELAEENAKFVEKISKCVLREPKYDPQEAQSSLRKVIHKSNGNVIVLRDFSNVTINTKRKKISNGRQLTFEI